MATKKTPTSTTAKKAPAKKAPAKKAPAKKAPARSEDAEVKFADEPVTDTVDNIVHVNDVKNKKTRRRMLGWFRRSK